MAAHQFWHVHQRRAWRFAKELVAVPAAVVEPPSELPMRVRLLALSRQAVRRGRRQPARPEELVAELVCDSPAPSRLAGRTGRRRPSDRVEPVAELVDNAAEPPSVPTRVSQKVRCLRMESKSHQTLPTRRPWSNGPDDLATFWRVSCQKWLSARCIGFRGCVAANYVALSKRPPLIRRTLGLITNIGS